MELTANEIIEKALVEARVIYPGESVPEAKVAAVFDQLNAMIESWALDTLLVRARVREQFSLVAGTAEYTYGDGGDFDSDYPLHLQNSVFIVDGDITHRCRQKSVDYYRSITLKTTTGEPDVFASEGDYPLRTVYFHPTPDKAYTVQFLVEKEFASFPDRTTSVDLPFGYSRAVISNLALEVMSGYGKKPAPLQIAIASDSLAAIKSHVNRGRKHPARVRALSRVTGSRPGRSILEGPFE